MAAIFNLLTDFGLEDPYVGQMKAVLTSQIRDCRIIDLCHFVRPQNILQAAFFLEASFDYLPRQSLCLAIIDPGVGTKRKIVLLRMQERWILAPDNGLLTLLLQRPGSKICQEIPTQEFSAASNTFHGRDVFCPLALKWAKCSNSAELGYPLDVKMLKYLELPEPTLSSRQLQATVLHIDHFGNCVLNLGIDKFWQKIEQFPGLKLYAPIPALIYPVSSYAFIPDSKLGIIPGSQGYLELAMNQNSCAQSLGLDIGHCLNLFI
jgi:S-adenosylmethionine hydrolase